MNNDVRPISYSKVYKHEFLRSMLTLNQGGGSLVELALMLTRMTLTQEENNTLAYSVVSTVEEGYLVYLSSVPITPQQVEENMKALDSIVDDQRQVKLLQAQYNVNFNAARAMRRDKLTIQKLQLELKQLKDKYNITTTESVERLLATWQNHTDE